MRRNLSNYTRKTAWVRLCLTLLLAFGGTFPMFHNGEVRAELVTTIVYITESGVGNQDGSSWFNAKPGSLLQNEIDNANPNTQIWVKAGTYVPMKDSEGRVNPEFPYMRSFRLKNGVAVYGGFFGFESSLEQRDLTKNVTIFSGDLGGGNHANNVFYHGPSLMLNNTAILDGVTITGGQAGQDSTRVSGGGMYNENASPSLTNVIIQGNTATGSAGGMYNYNSNPIMTRVTIEWNTSFDSGGGIYNQLSVPTLTDVTINNNTVSKYDGGGGGIYNNSSNATLTNVTIRENTAGIGGGIYNDSSDPILTNVTVSGNAAGLSAGGIYNLESGSKLTNVMIKGNMASVHGGGLFIDGSKSMVLTNVLISGNNAGGSGGGLFFNNNSSILTNVTISGNAASDGGGGMFTGQSSSPVVRNSIIWGNTAKENPNIGNSPSGGNPTFSNSLIQGSRIFFNFWNSSFGTDGGSNLDADPLFVDAKPASAAPTDLGDYRISANSPAADVGNNNVFSPAYTPDLSAITFDLEGNPRIRNSWVDLGAYEFSGDTIVYVTESGAGNKDGSSWINALPGNKLQDAINRAPEGTQIWVAAGTYIPTMGFGGNTNPLYPYLKSFQLKSGVAVYGGFAGTESSLDQRDFIANETIFSGDLGDGNHAANVFYHECNVYRMHVDNTAILDGATITGGKAEKGEFYNAGGGMINASYCSPTLTNVKIINNYALGGGGGIFNIDHSNPTLTNVTIQGNTTKGIGGGIYNGPDASPIMTDVTIIENESQATADSHGGGGGMYNDYNCFPVMTRVTIERNKAYGSGGGMNNYQANPILTDVTISGNTATTGEGGGMYSIQTNMTMTDVTISNNTAIAGDGGGIYNAAGSMKMTNVLISGNRGKDGGGIYSIGWSRPPMVMTLTNVLVSGNKASGNGGGIYINFGSLFLTNATISGNAAGKGGGMWIENKSSPTVRNSIIWNNSANTSRTLNKDDSSTATFSRSLIQDAINENVWSSSFGTDGGGNLNADPLFADPKPASAAPTVTGDYRISSNSPAAGAGDTNVFSFSATPFLADITVDLAGNPRIVNNKVNMGAYQTTVTMPDNSTISPTTATFDKNTGDTSAGHYQDVTTTLTLKGNTLSSIKNGTSTLVQNTDYTVSGSTVMIKKQYLEKQSIGTTTLTFTFNAGNPQTLTITVSDTSLPSNSAISPKTGNFDKYASSVGHANIATTLTLNGNTLDSIANGAKALVLNTDYLMNGNIVTIKKEYLAQQPVGTTSLTFQFSAGVPQTLTITVTDTSLQSNSTISPKTGSFFKNASLQADVTTTLTLNGNTLSGITNGGTPLVSGTDYTIAGNIVKIKKVYLAKQPVGTTILTFNFSSGNSQTLTIDVKFPQPTPAPDFTPTPDPKPGTEPGTTGIPDVTPEDGNHLVVKVSSTIIDTPNEGDDAPTTGVINPYRAGDDIPGVDAKVNRYIGLYEVDANGKVVRFRLIVLNDEDVKPTPQPTPAPGFTPTPDPVPGTEPGTTGIPGVTPGDDNRLVVKVSSTIIETPNVGDDAPTTGVGMIDPYRTGDDIPGVDAKVNRYIGLYEVNAQGKVVKFRLIVLNEKDVKPTPQPMPVPDFTPTPDPEPGTEPGTTGIPDVTPEDGNHLVVKVSSTIIDTPNEGDDAPTTGVINPYRAGDDIPGVDAKVNRYIGLYEVDANGKVVRFRLIVLNDEDVNTTPQPTPAPGFQPTPKPRPGTNPGTTGIPDVTPGGGNHLVVKVSSTIIDTPNVGDDAPTTGVGVIDPYRAGDDIPGVDAKVNRYIGLYEVDADGKVVRFRLIVLNEKDVKPTPQPTPVPDFTPTPGPEPGTDPGTTGIPDVTPEGGNHLVVKVSSTIIDTPNEGDDAPTTGVGVINPYRAGDDIPGVDAKVNRYIGLYEVDAQGKVIRFRLIILNDEDVNTTPQPTPVPGFQPTPKPRPGTNPGTTGISDVTPGGGNHLVVKVSSTIIETPNEGDDAPTTGVGVIDPYRAGDDIPGVDAKVNRYIGLYEVDADGKVVRFRLIVLNEKDVKPTPQPMPVPDFMPTPDPGPGTEPGTTGIPDVTPEGGNHLVVKVSSTIIDTPNEGDDAPTTGVGVINPYRAGDDIPGVDAKVNRYIGLYEVDAQGKVIRFRLIVLNDEDVNTTPQPTPVPGFQPTPKPRPGTNPGTTGIPDVTPGGGNHLVVKVSSTIIETPNEGDDAPTTGVGVIDPYRAGDDIPGVDAKVNRYIGLYEVNAQGKVVRFRLIVLNEKDVKPTPQPTPVPDFMPTPDPEPGTEPGTTDIPDVTPEGGNHLVVKVSSTIIDTPNEGDDAPTPGVGVINPYRAGDDIPGVDAKVNRYIGLYEVDANGKVVKFRLIVLNDEDVNTTPQPTPVPGFQPTPKPRPGTNPGTTGISGVTPGGGNHLVVKVSSTIIDTPNVGDDAPTTGVGVIDPYRVGDDIPGVDAKVNRYIGLYEVNAQGKVVRFRLFISNQQDISLSIPDHLIQDRDQIDIGYQAGDNKDHVSKKLNLPGIGPSRKTTVKWISSNEDYIDSKGHVTRPSVDEQDVYVTLTAIIRDNETGAETNKTFVVKVVKLTDEDAVREAAKQLTIDNAFTFAQGDTWESVTLPFLMLGTGMHGTSIAWSSADPSTIEITTQDGNVRANVTRPESKDKHVLLTATIMRGNASITKTFLMVIVNRTVVKEDNQTRQPTARNAEASANPDGIPNKVQFTILRTNLSDGTRIDTIIVDPAKIEQLTDLFDPGDSQESNRTVVIKISQPADDPAEEIAVEIPSSAITAIADRNGLLEIRTDEGSIYLDSAALKKLADQGSDLYFRIVPVHNIAEQSDATDALKSSDLLKQASKGKVFKRLDIPRKIETNLTGSTTKVVLPLSSANLRGINVSSLRVFVEHSDGTTELLSGAIVYEGGQPTGFIFEINSFSRFQVIAEELSGGGSGVSGKYFAPAFNPSATLDQGSKGGTTKVNAPPPRGGNRIVIQISDKPVSVPNVGDPAPVGKGVIDPYRIGSDIAGVDPENNRYIAVYEVDSDNRIVRFQLLLLSKETIRASTGLIDLYLNDRVQKETAMLEEYAANGKNTAIITVDNEEIIKQVMASETGIVLRVPQVTDSKYVKVVMNGELLKSMTRQDGVFRIESMLAIYTVQAAAIDSKKLFAELGNPSNLSEVQVTFTIALADPAVEMNMKMLAGKNKAVIEVSPIQFSISAELNGTKVEVDQFNNYVQRAIRITDDAQLSRITTGVSVSGNDTLLHMPTRIEILDGERFAIVNSLYNGPFALISKKLSFGDVKGHWAAEIVHDLAARSIVKGTSIDKFEPNRSITRAEFVTILVQALGLKRGPQAEQRFSDVKQTDWYDEFVATATEFKLVSGYKTGEFKPMNAITREEAMAIIANAMKLVGLYKKVGTDTVKAKLSAYTDSSQASEWARDSIALLTETGIVSGRTVDKLEPKADITRAESATIVLKLMQVLSLINGSSSGK